MNPNFFIVGAAKSGTTSLWTYLRQHPQIFFPENKEPNYFAYADRHNISLLGPADPEILRMKLHPRTITDFETYKSLFQGVSKRAVGEASVRYLYFPKACERIHETLPQSKIIIILRNPVDRLYSHFLMMKGLYSLEPLSLVEALQQENDRIAADWDWDWHYVHVSLYFEQVRRYLEKFGSDNVRVFIYEDFCRCPLDIIREIFDFLDVDSDFVPDMSARGMQAYWPRYSSIDWLLRSPNLVNASLMKSLPKKAYNELISYGMRLNKGKPPQLPEVLRDQLKTRLKEDISNLENLLGKKLPW